MSETYAGTDTVRHVRRGLARRAVRALRRAVATLRERRAEQHRCAVLAVEYASRPARLRAGATRSHRAPSATAATVARVRGVSRRRVTSMRAPRATRTARHAPGGDRVHRPATAQPYRRGHGVDGRALLAALCDPTSWQWAV